MLRCARQEITAPSMADTTSLLDELATVLLHAEGAPDTEFFRQITWVYLNEIDPARLAVGGRPGGAPRYRVDVTVPQGQTHRRCAHGGDRRRRSYPGRRAGAARVDADPRGAGR
jgi:hypothetical protein